MKHKLLFTLLTLLTCFGFSQRVSATDYEVSTASEFINAIKNHKEKGAVIKLTCDIDLNWQYNGMYDGYFYATIDGQNHTLKNWSLESNGKRFDHGAFLKDAYEATVRNLTIENFRIYAYDRYQCKAGLLFANSQKSNYINVTIKGDSYIWLKDSNSDTAGLLCGYSEGDTFEDCSTESNCYVSVATYHAGGLAGQAKDDTFRRCYNAAMVHGLANIGGIAGTSMGKCTFDHCLNTGRLPHSSQEAYTGGIVGKAEECDITYCVNNGTIQYNYDKTPSKVSGIVGYIERGSITNCFNWGPLVNKDPGKGNPICGENKGATESDNMWDCNVKGSSAVNYCNGWTRYKMVNGAYAFATEGFYQNLENSDNSYPMPIPYNADGFGGAKVYQNVLCYGDVYYSNKSDGCSAAHTLDLNRSNNTCRICGAYHIVGADALVQFASSVNNGTDYSGYHIYIDGSTTDATELDMSGKVFTPIGIKDHPFSGWISGHFVRIKNLNINTTGNNVGLFGAVGGKNTVIKNVIMDSSSSVEATGEGIAGIVGGVVSNSGSTCMVTIQNCGNEATITGHRNINNEDDNTAGILGGVYNNDNAQIYIYNCYNTGAIKGVSGSATICGYARKNYDIRNCYNSGTLTGADGNDKFYRYYKGERCSYVANCYDTNENSNGVTHISSDDLTSGVLQNNLDGYINSLSKNPRKDYKFFVQGNTHPQFDANFDSDKDYLCFTAKIYDGVSVKFSQVGTATTPAPSLMYSTDKTTWTEYTLGTEITLSEKKDKVYFSAKESSPNKNGFSQSTSNYIHFSSTGNVAASGNIMSLIDHDCEETTVPACAFINLFKDCTTLTVAPSLPFTYATHNSCEGMFYGCTGLKAAPALPATQLASECYKAMFQGCTSLTSAPELPATRMQRECYSSMFYGCTSLATAPALPATTLAENCYYDMFYGCTALTTVPALTASELQKGCYSGMFQGCTSLTEAPKLLATTLQADCYDNMFSGCTKLNNVMVRFTEWMSGATDNWLNGVASTGTFYCPLNLACPELVEGSESRSASTIPSGWMVSQPNDLCFTSHDANTIKFAVTGTLTNTPKLQYSKNNGSWTDYTLGSEIYLDNNDIIYFKAGSSAESTYKTNSTFSKDADNYITFSATGKIAASGSIMSLLDASCQQTNVPTYAFRSLFYGCDKLTSVPGLPATTLSQGCYMTMFQGCTSLTSTSPLPATKMSRECYRGMFYGCTGLTRAPELSSTELASYCYYDMFNGCTALATAPALPTIDLHEGCYIGMFQGCTSLTEAPELPAIALTAYCYNNMFKDCKNLKKVVVQFTYWMLHCTDDWLSGVSDLGFFTCPSELSSASRSASTIPSRWIVNGTYPTVTLNSSAIATYSSAYPVSISTEGVNAYKASVENNVINLTKIEGYIPAGTGVFLYGKNMANTTVEFQAPESGSTSASVDDNAFQPTTTADSALVDVPESGTKWVLSGGSFVKYTGTTFRENRAYLIHELTNGAKAMTCVFDDDTPTAIEDVSVSVNVNLDGKYMENGCLVIIKNGRKYSSSGQLLK